MHTLLHLVFEYRKLSDTLPAQLSPSAKERLVALERLFGKEPGNGYRRHARCDVDLPAAIESNGVRELVTVVNLGGGGLCVTPAPSMDVGDRGVVTFVDDDGTVYEYPVQVGWTATREASSMGMAFIGPAEQHDKRERYLRAESCRGEKLSAVS